MEPVQLHLYDISHGLATKLGPLLLGHEVEGLYHVGISVGGIEYAAGPPVRRYLSHEGPLGAPDKVVDLGVTSMPSALIAEIVNGLTPSYNVEQYNLLFHNCIHFANELAQMLTGNSLPAGILNQTQELLNSPLGEHLIARWSATTACTAIASPGQPLAGHGEPVNPTSSGNTAAPAQAAAATATAATDSAGDGAGPSEPHKTPPPPPPTAAAQGAPLELPVAGQAFTEMMRDVLAGLGAGGSHAGFQHPLMSLLAEAAEAFGAAPGGTHPTATGAAAPTAANTGNNCNGHGSCRGFGGCDRGGRGVWYGQGGHPFNMMMGMAGFGADLGCGMGVLPMFMVPGGCRGWALRGGCDAGRTGGHAGAVGTDGGGQDAGTSAAADAACAAGVAGGGETAPMDGDDGRQSAEVNPKTLNRKT